MTSQIVPPSTMQMKHFLVNLQCSVCWRLFENAKSLSCQHVFCERCLSNLVKASSVRSSQNVLGEMVQRNTIACPVCRQSFPAKEFNDARPQKILSDLSKLFQDVMESRPQCAMCSNQRWVVHGTDYTLCETCDKVLCPLCALESHREHELKSNFLSMLQSRKEFLKQMAPVKKDWNKILKQIEESKENATKTNKWIDDMKSNLKAMEATLYAMITPSTNAYNNVQKLNGLQFDDKIETARVEALKNLELEVNKVTDKINPLIEDVNKKVALLTEALKAMKSVSETKMEEANAESQFSPGPAQGASAS